jgi:hypothetical protein
MEAAVPPMVAAADAAVTAPAVADPPPIAVRAGIITA